MCNVSGIVQSGNQVRGVSDADITVDAKLRDATISEIAMRCAAQLDLAKSGPRLPYAVRSGAKFVVGVFAAGFLLTLGSLTADVVVSWWAER